MSLTFLLAVLVFPATASADFAHTVTRGESLASVAAADGLPVTQLAAANGLSSSSYLQAGSVLQIPPQEAGVSTAPATTEPVASSGEPAATSPASTSVGSGGGYVVRPGDTLSGIAAANGLSVSELAAENGLDQNAFLLAGTSLTLGGSAAEPVSTASSAPSGGAQGGPTVSSGMASASDVGQIAAANGVSPSLAEAIGYQESGFNNAMVSSTGATGVMQLEPGTVSYINRFLGAGVSPYSVTDNIRGGVVFLHSLLGETGGDPALAAAAYYQGLGSVRAHGLLPSTQRYVNDVLALRARFGG
jgi:LysM repeat protein